MSVQQSVCTASWPIETSVGQHVADEGKATGAKDHNGSSPAAETKPLNTTSFDIQKSNIPAGSQENCDYFPRYL